MADRIRRAGGGWRPEGPRGPVPGPADSAASGPRERTRLSGPEVAAAALAGLAEAGIVFLPLRVILGSVMTAGAGPLLTYPIFLALYAGGVALTADLRRIPGLPVAVAVGCGAVGLAQAQVWASGVAAVDVVLTAVLALGVGARMVFLAARDWRDPISTTFAVGAGVALLEALAMGSVPQWRVLSASVVGMFFVCALASRAMSVLASGDMSPRAADRRLARRFSGGMIGVAAAGLALAGLLAGRNGPLALMGSAALRVVGAVLVAIVFVLVQLVRPIFWLAQRVHVNPAAWRKAVSHLQTGSRKLPLRVHQSAGSAAVQRLLGLLLLALVAWLLFRMIRRRLAEHGPVESDEAAEPEVEWRPVVQPAPEARRRLRGRRRPKELPEQTVRRWYAESLLLLESKGMPRARWTTPAEFDRQVALAVPEAADGFGALTRSYEDARYGLLDLDRAGLAALSKVVDELAAALRRWPGRTGPSPAAEPEGG